MQGHNEGEYQCDHGDCGHCERTMTTGFTHVLVRSGRHPHVRVSWREEVLRILCTPSPWSAACPYSAYTRCMARAKSSAE